MRIACSLILFVSLTLAGCRRQAPEVKLEDAPTVTLSVEPGSVRVEPGLTSRVKVAVSRKNCDEALRLELRNLPVGLTATPANAESRNSEVEVELAAAPTIEPGDKAGVQVVTTVGDQQVKSPAFSITVTKPAITYTFEPTHLKIPKGESRTLSVKFYRGREAYQGPVIIALANLPRNVTATPQATSPESASFLIKAGADASEGDTQPLVRVEGEKILRGVGLFPLTVQGAPFVLKAEPDRVNAVFGQTVKVKITATRRDYQGPIAIRVDEIPGAIKIRPLYLQAKQNSGELEMTISADALSMERVVQVRANAEDKRGAQASFHLTVEGKPFGLLFQPQRLEVVQGSANKLKVMAQRSKDYAGPINLEVRNLPKDTKATSLFGIPSQGKEGEIEFSADEAAALGVTQGVHIVGTAKINGEKREIINDRFTLAVVPPFSLQVQPGRIEIVEGQKTTVKVRAERRTYKGTIDVELKNLPPGVSAAQAVIGREQNVVDVELTAGVGSVGTVKPDVHAVGVPINKREIASGNVTVAVLSRLFELKVEKTPKVAPGDKALVKVTAQRLDYKGPIALELKNLPKLVTATRAVIPEGQNEIDVEIAAGDEARETKGEAHIVGTAVGQGNQQRASGPFLVQVLPGLFALKIETPQLQLVHGGSAKVTVSAHRKGHDGPIEVELKNLPKSMKADKATIPAGANRTEIEVKAQATVAEGASVDVFARSVAQGKNIDSQRMTVTVVSIGQQPGLELKIEPASIKLTPGTPVKVKVTATRKDYAGPIAVELRNLPPEVECTKGMIEVRENVVELTLTAKAKAEPATRVDVCAVGVTFGDGARPYASPQISVQVGRK